MESFLRNLTKQVICSICLETFKEPKIISCFHTFCCECLEKHARVSQRHGKFRCPECQAEIHLPEGNRFEALPTSFFHNSLLIIHAVRQSGDVTSLVATVRGLAPMSITALIVLDSCVPNVCTHMKLCAMHSRDTKRCLSKTSKIKITKLC